MADGRGDMTVVMARVDSPDGSVVRLGVVNPEDTRRWAAEDKGSTVELDVPVARQLRDALPGMQAKASASVAAFKAAGDAGEPDEDLGSVSLRSNWGVPLKVRAERTEDGWSIFIDPSGDKAEPFRIGTARTAGQLVKAIDNLTATAGGTS